jgi:hypothetical protein
MALLIMALWRRRRNHDILRLTSANTLIHPIHIVLRVILLPFVVIGAMVLYERFGVNLR